MQKAIRAKFSQNPDIGRVLKETADAELIEHTANDAYWGDGGDGTGQNMPGRFLMELRGEL